MLRRLRLPLPLALHTCRCGDKFGQKRASCTRAGVLGRRGFGLHRAHRQRPCGAVSKPCLGVGFPSFFGVECVMKNSGCKIVYASPTTPSTLLKSCCQLPRHHLCPMICQFSSKPKLNRIGHRMFGDRASLRHETLDFVLSFGRPTQGRDEHFCPVFDRVELATLSISVWR